MSVKLIETIDNIHLGIYNKLFVGLVSTLTISSKYEDREK
jgi:hypothetical protein